MNFTHRLRKTDFAGMGCLATIVLLIPCLTSRAQEPLFEGLGSYTRTVTTPSPAAQRYFNQGLAFLHGFNHGAAIRSFQEAARLDPTCAMAHWGIALASGPHINFPLVPPPAAELAWKELTLARQYASQGTPVEQALIEALGHRYANPQPEDRTPLDVAYADAMREVWRTYPDDPDVGVFFAEAMMNLRPWNQWSLDGVAQPGTEEIIDTLDAVLKLSPNQPLANHLYIHAVEASPHPGRADEAAERLRGLQPGLAHNVHMPSHIDVRRGRWQTAVESNLKAVEADRKYREVVGQPKGFIHLYVAHNRHMLAYAAMMTGQSALALEHIRAMVAGMPEEFLKEYALVAEGFAAAPLEVLIRFGRWDDILEEPGVYPEYMPYTRAFRHAARAIAFAAKGQPENAREEQARFLELSTAVTAEQTIGNSHARDLLEVAKLMVEGEILIREDRLDAGVEALRAAVALEDQLAYDEPKAWIIPVRHSLGAVLMSAGRIDEAEQVYRDDLARLPENGWSLYGLRQCLRARHAEAAELADVDQRFQKIWANADIRISSSCLCVPGRAL